MNPVIDVSQLSHRYGSRIALDKISFSVHEGNFFCFLGPNGAGKSTTVKVLAGQLPVQQGKVVLNGKDVSKVDLRTIKYHVGVLTDDMSLPKEFTVRELLYFVGRAFDLSPSRAKAKCEDVISKVGLEKYGDVRVGHLSSGLRSRLSIGQALVNSARILFLDEPTTALDPMSSREILSLIKNLHDEGVTIFYTTHLLKEVEFLCTHFAVIESGRILFCGRLSDLKERFGAAVEIETVKDNVPVIMTLTKRQGWKTIVDGNIISVCFTTRNEAEFSLDNIATLLHKNRLKYSRIAICLPSLEDLYARIVAVEKKI